MRRVWAIAGLTLREGFRMRIVLVSLIVLVFLVLRMPFALRGDETLAGRLQNFLAYSLGALSVLLSLATVFFSCSTLSAEFRTRTLHLVATKPVTRFQILLGKWLGVNALNVLIVILCGAAIYGLAYFIQSQPEQFVRDRYKIRDVVWTARHAANPVVPREQIEQAAQARVRDLIEKGELDPIRARQALDEQRDAALKQWRVIRPGYVGDYLFEGLAPPEREDTVVQVRFKLIGHPLPPDETLTVGWVFVDPNSGAPISPLVWTRERTGARHQFLVRAAPVIRDGRARLQVVNAPPETEHTLIFDGQDSLQILYKVGAFELNFVRALLIILLRLALLSAVGVFFSVFVSFPVACLCTGAFYVVCLGMPFWLEAMGVDTDYVPDPEERRGLRAAWRALFIPLVRLAFPNFSYYDGTDRLIDGLNIPLELLGRCVVHTLLYGIVLLFVFGWWIFHRREIAEVQV